MLQRSEPFRGAVTLASGLLTLLSAWLFSNNYLCAWIGAAVVVTFSVAFAGAVIGELPERWQARARRVRIAVAAALAIGIAFVPPLYLSPARAFGLATDRAGSPGVLNLQRVRCTYLGGPGDYELVIRFTATAESVAMLTRTQLWRERSETNEPETRDHGVRVKMFQMDRPGSSRTVRLPAKLPEMKRPQYYFFERDESAIGARDTFLIWDEATREGFIVHAVG